MQTWVCLKLMFNFWVTDPLENRMKPQETFQEKYTHKSLDIILGDSELLKPIHSQTPTLENIRGWVFSRS